MDQLTLTPDPEAKQLAEGMGQADDVMREIIAETINSANNGDIKEAGRTVCPGSGAIKGPLRRYPRAIDLASCPKDKGGSWHVHVTPHELRTPVNSLPDMANVVYGLMDVSVVAGTQTADVIHAAEDTEAMQEAFNNAIGLKTTGPRDLYRAIRDRRVSPTPARERARRALDDVIMTVPTGYEDIDATVDEVPSANWAAPRVSGPDEAFSGPLPSPKAFDANSVDDAAEKADTLVGGSGLGGLVISTTIGTVVGGLIDRVIFGD